jgi:protein-tyrosine phosphatase
MKILFVCSANICRSALCEAVLKKKLAEKGFTGVVVESAGIHDYGGEPRDPTMVSYASKAGYELGGNPDGKRWRGLLSMFLILVIKM